MNLSPDDKDRLWQDPKKTSWFRFSNPLRYVIFLIVLISLLIGLWYLISPTHQLYNKTALSLIRADQKPYKIKAESQGVPSVKHQDKLVYGRIRADQNEPVAEHILPDPEAPLPEIKESRAPIKMVEQYLPEDVDPDKVIETSQEKSEKSVLSITSIEDLIEELPEETQAPKEKAIREKSFIQLGSLKSYDLAELEWKRLLKKYPDVLRGLEPIIQKVDLGEEKGIYYRLRTGSFEDAKKAHEVCINLQEQKGGCIVVP